jgi:hypothetical protein
MANVNVKQRLDRIGRELDTVAKHISMYSGITKADAMLIDNMATAIAEGAARIAREARLAMGNRSADRVVPNVRKALGFTRP